MFFSLRKPSSGETSPRKTRARTVLANILKLLINALILLLFFGKALMLPVGIALSPVSNSHINRLDLMIITPGYIGELNRGDLVLACRGGWWNTACVTGILNGGFNGNRQNGNGNGLPSVSVLGNGNGFRGTLLINGDIRLFRIIGRIPGEIWIPALTMYLYYLALEIRRVFKKSRVLGESTSLVALSAVIVVVNAFIVGATYVDQVAVTYALPEIRVTDTFYLHNSSLLLSVATQGDYVLLNAECNLTFNGANRASNGANGVNSLNGKTNGATANGPRSRNGNGNGRNGNGHMVIGLHTTILDQRTILVEIPFEAYMFLFNRTRIEELPVMPAIISVEMQLPISCRLVFDRFEHIFVVYAGFYWKDLDVRVRQLRWLTIDNANPVCVNATLTIFDIDRNRIVLRDMIEIHRLSTIEYDLWELNITRARIILEYELLGLNRMRIGYYDREPWRRTTQS